MLPELVRIARASGFLKRDDFAQKHNGRRCGIVTAIQLRPRHIRTSRVSKYRCCQCRDIPRVAMSSISLWWHETLVKAYDAY